MIERKPSWIASDRLPSIRLPCKAAMGAIMALVVIVHISVPVKSEDKNMNLEDKWSMEMKQGKEALTADDWVSAEKHFREAFGLAQENFPIDDIRRGKSLYFLGHMRLITGGASYGDDGRFQEAAEILEKSSEPESKKLLVDALLGQGEMASRLGKNDESIPVLERALTLAQTEYGANNAKCADILYSLGLCYGLRQHFDKSVQVLKQAIDLFEHSKRYKELSSALADLASVLDSAGRSEESQEAQSRADEVARQHGVGFSWSY